MKIAIIGRTQILYETALKLRREGHQIGCVITAQAAPEYTKNEDDFKRLAEETGAVFVLTKTLNNPEVEAACQGLDIGISINWISVIGQQHIDWFRLGILNSHHGDLPRYRGNACSNWAILNDEKEVVNTIHFMKGGELDCGNIVHQDFFELDENRSITDVYRWSEESTPDAFVEALTKLEADSGFMLKYADPNAENSFRCYPRLPEDGFIDWKTSATQINNLVRAVTHPFSGAYTFHREKDGVRKLIVFESRVVSRESKDMAMPGHVLLNDKNTGESFVSCSAGVIALKSCRYEDEDEEFAPGKRWKSIRMRLGVRAEDWLWNIYKNTK